MIGKHLIKLSLGLIMLIAASCANKVTKDYAWNSLLIDLDASQAKHDFSKLIDKEPNDSSHYLGLAYSSCILEDSNWMSYLDSFSSSSDKIWEFGHSAVAFKNWVVNPELQNREFNYELFKAQHLSSSFVTKNMMNQTIKGAFKNYEPSGLWQVLDSNGHLIREIKH